MKVMLAGAVSLKSPAFDGMPHGSTVTRPTERNAEMLERLEERYAERIAELTAAIDEALTFASKMDVAIAKLEPKEQRVLELMYKEQCNAFRTARLMSYEVAQIWRIENAACESIANMIQNDTEDV